jgi:hypothetical protein
MADGTYKPIEQLRVGDMVLATDPETGETGPRAVLAPLASDGIKNLVQITVDTDGTAGDQTGTLTATDNHPFWIADLKFWQTAGDLQAGSLLQTAAGTEVQVTAVRASTVLQRVHNLTVHDIHTYFVLAGTTPVLVHNDNGICDTAGQLGNLKPTQQTRGWAQQEELAQLSDEDLLKSINDPLDGDVILILPDGRQLGGHHRIDELRKRVADGRISPDTRIRIEMFNPDTHG